MEVIIDNTYSIIVDHYNHTLVEYLGGTDSRGNPKKESHGYFQSVDAALEKLAIIKITSREEELQLNEYIDTLREEIRLLREAVEWKNVD